MMINKNDYDVAESYHKDSFNLLFNKIEDFLFILDEEGRVIRTNQATLEMLDQTHEEMINMKLELLHPLTRHSEMEEIVKGMQEEGTAKCLIPLYCKSGKQILLETRVFKGKWVGENVLYGIGKEIVEVKADDQQLELELANQKRFLKTMLDTIPDFIFYKDTNSVLLGCNKGYAEKVLGVNEDEARGKTDIDLIKDLEMSKLCQQKDREILVSAKMLKYDGKFVLTDGSVINTEILKTPLYNEQGNVTGLIGIARDITERKELEKQLKEQAEYAELLFKTVPNAVVSIDKHRKIIRWNKIAEEITGYTAEEVIGKECSKVLHGVDKVDCAMCLRVNESPLINEKCKVVTKDGRNRNVLKSVAVLRDELGRISERMECFEDITGMIEMETELRESKERYAAIVNNAPQIVIIHKKGIIQFLNDAGKEALGYRDEECIFRHIKGYMTKESFAHINRTILDGIRGEQRGSYEIELIKRSGEIINVLVKDTDIYYEGEKATLAVMMDITESKQLNVKLQMSEEKFRQLAETINEVFLITDQESIVYVSPAYERISGMSCQSLLDDPRSFIELIHPVDRERIQLFFFYGFQTLNKVTNTNEEFRIIRPDGEIRWLWLQSYSVRDGANSNALKATIIVDITDRKEIEEKLRERERLTQMEILFAARVQRDSLPLPFTGDKVNVYTIFEPSSTVSGDLFNYKWLEDQNKLCGYIIDVSGHGVATALQTATFKMLLDNVLLTGETIEEDTLQIINQRIMQYLHEDSFVALLYFEFDIKAGVLKLISAGITLFMVATSLECSLVPVCGCYLGIVDNPDMETKIIPLKAGEIYCMMTDGASDLLESYGINKQGNFTEYKRLFEKLAESPDRNDDFSVICIEVLQGNTEINVIDIKNDEELGRAQEIISEFLKRNTPIHAPLMEVAVNEAMNNGFFACGRVCVKTRRLGNKLIIRVKDNCQGFDTHKVNVQLKKEMYEEEFGEMLEAEGGRGILLMKLICDKVIYNSIGNEVLLMKRI
ncbi:MAG: hypothetical protein APF81_25295 [Desulfosporosinus sp. BRH_c37]|nr:MAG: hypothetical protein APF81_25295 [Desulfosporosinus sp. BRH_c37]